MAPTATQALAVFQQVNTNDATQLRGPSQSRIRWSPPAKGEIKVNFDRVQFRDMGKAGFGVVFGTIKDKHLLPYQSKQVFLFLQT